MKSISIAQTRTVLSQIMTPLDANVLGNVFGGSILSMIDLTASATAQKFSGQTCVTASFDRVDFHEPIAVGSLVEMEGYVGFVGRSSMEIVIDVFATNLKEGLRRHTNTAHVTMVAIHDGKPVSVPRLLLETKQDKVRFIESKLRKELRNRYLNEISEQNQDFSSMDEERLDELIQSESVLLAIGL